jgi:hypothetical protein
MTSELLHACERQTWVTPAGGGAGMVGPRGRAALPYLPSTGPGGARGTRVWHGREALLVRPRVLRAVRQLVKHCRPHLGDLVGTSNGKSQPKRRCLSIHQPTD